MLDSELGYMVALAEELRKRDVAAFPARTVRDAQALLTKFRLRPDVMVVNCACAGASSFVRSLSKSAAGVQIVAITSGRRNCRECGQVLAAMFRHPEDRQLDGVERCAGVIQVLVKQLRRHARRASQEGKL